MHPTSRPVRHVSHVGRLWPRASSLNSHGAARQATRLSRRALLAGTGALVLVTTPGMHAIADSALDVHVGELELLGIQDCKATVRVQVTLSGGAAQARYALYGQVFEADDDAPANGGSTRPNPDDACCGFDPEVVEIATGEECRVSLSRTTWVTDLGLHVGEGPASDETTPRGRIRLYARIRARDLATRVVLGPWESPRSDFIPQARLTQAQHDALPGAIFMVPQPGDHPEHNATIGMPTPPRSCER